MSFIKKTELVKIYSQDVEYWDHIKMTGTIQAVVYKITWFGLWKRYKYNLTYPKVYGIMDGHYMSKRIIKNAVNLFRQELEARIWEMRNGCPHKNRFTNQDLESIH